MYEPIKKFFVSMGYEVRAEVKNCDITLVKDGELTVIEMKKAFNMTLLFQCMERQAITSQVYAAIPNLRRMKNGNLAKTKKVCKSLGIGLITVDVWSALKTIEIVQSPPVPEKLKTSKKSAELRDNVMKEISGRSDDYNTGGAVKKKLATAYRETVIHVACALESALRDGDAFSGIELIKDYSAPPNATGVLRNDFYGWFRKVGGKRYTLSDEGRAMLEDGEFAELVRVYRYE
jgi:hypothetical protein